MAPRPSHASARARSRWRPSRGASPRRDPGSSRSEVLYPSTDTRRASRGDRVVEHRPPCSASSIASCDLHGRSRSRRPHEVMGWPRCAPLPRIDDPSILRGRRPVTLPPSTLDALRRRAGSVRSVYGRGRGSAAAGSGPTRRKSIAVADHAGNVDSPVSTSASTAVRARLPAHGGSISHLARPGPRIFPTSPSPRTGIVLYRRRPNSVGEQGVRGVPTLPTATARRPVSRAQHQTLAIVSERETTRAASVSTRSRWASPVVVKQVYAALPAIAPRARLGISSMTSTGVARELAYCC